MRSFRQQVVSAAVLGIASWVLAATSAVLAAEASVVPVSDTVAPLNRSRPRVGLVLGGGGARGAAHIGVLRELENMRVPVDVIVGTSMGAIVGGLYASGVSVDELEDTVRTLDWAAALADRSERRDMSFRRKKDDEQFPINFEIGFRDSEIQLPQGVIPGHRLDLVLRELTLHASGVTDFDELPIPFRAIASDMVAGEPYVMGEGDLALAIRASMSVPAAFAPVIIDDRLLVDGGLVGNLGVDVIQEMGVDVIIAVDVEFPLYEFEQLDSAVAISEQMLTLLIRKETRRQIERLGPGDVLIQPDLGVFGSTNFAAAGETIEPGAAATRAVADRLSTIAVSEEDYTAYTSARTRLEIHDEPLAFVRVVHDAGVRPEILATRIDVQPGDPLDAAALARAADRLNGLRLFERVGYRLVEEGGATGVEFDVRAKSWGPNFLRFGLLLQEDFEGSTAFNLSARWRRPEVNELGAEWLTDVQLGTDPLLTTEFYQPLRFDSRVFVAPAIRLSQTNRNAFVVGEAVARLRFSEAVAQLDVGAEIGTVGEFRTGFYRGGGEGRVKVGDPSISNFDFESGGVLTRLRFDTFDNAQFPRRGINTSLTWDASRTSLGADSNFDTLEFNFDGAISRGQSTLVAGLNYATTLDSLAPVQNFFQLGGLLRLSGLERGQISGPHYGLARLVYFRQIGDSTNSILAIPMYVGASLEAGNVWQTRDAISLDSLRTNGSLFFGLDTPIGPVYLAAGFAEQGDTNVYLFIGATPR